MTAHPVRILKTLQSMHWHQSHEHVSSEALQMIYLKISKYSDLSCASGN